MRRGFWAGLDVGVETTSICVIDDAGGVLQQSTSATDLGSICKQLGWLRRRRSARIGLEAGALTLARGLRSRGYCVDVYETRQLSKFLRVRRNKTDAGDAIGIAEAGRIGASLVGKIHLKSLECQVLQSRLALRRFLIRQRVAAVNQLCRQIELYGGRVRRAGRSTQLRDKVELEIPKLFGNRSTVLAAELRHLLGHCEGLVAYQQVTDCELRRLALDNEVCRRFMAIPGVGPICALTFYAAVGDPHRFRRSKAVGPYLGLAPKLRQSGLSSRQGRISRMGNVAARTALVQAAMVLMRSSNGASEIARWAATLELRRGRPKARIALARKLAVIMLALWKSGESYSPRLAVAGESL
ncbi:MAG: IS110 family transposase [Sphingomicrobium sp.]